MEEKNYEVKEVQTADGKTEIVKVMKWPAQADTDNSWGRSGYDSLYQ